MLENETSDDAARAAEETTKPAGDTGAQDLTGGETASPARSRRRAASRPAGPPPDFDDLPPAPPVARPVAEVEVEVDEAVEAVEAGPSAQTGDETTAQAVTAGEAGDEIGVTAGEDAAAAQEQEEEEEQEEQEERREEPDEEVSATEATEAAGSAADGADESGAAAAPEAGRRRRSRGRRPATAEAGPAGPGESDRPETGTGQAGRPATAPPPVPGVVPMVQPPAPVETGQAPGGFGVPAVTFQPPMVVFQPPQPVAAPPARSAAKPPAAEQGAEEAEEEPEETTEPGAEGDEAETGETGDRPSRRRRRRGGRGRGKGRDAQSGDEDEDEDESERPDRRQQAEKAEKAGRPDKTEKAQKADKQERGERAETADEADEADEDEQTGGGSRRRRRRRRRSTGADGEDVAQDELPPNTVVHVREARVVADEVQSVRGSTRLEAKKQRRREGREQGRRRPPIITESEFLARRESVERTMVVRRRGERTQIAVLEDDVLVEHYVDRASHQSYVGNVYLGKVQNVLPSMEAAFVDIGKGRNAVLYAGEVNWDVAGLEGHPRRIESALKSGQSVLVQVTKDPLGHKGARLTSQVSLPGRYLVYVPDGSMTGISRKLPDKERSRLKQILKRVMPENAGVIVRTAAEGASEEELARDINRLAEQWEDIQRKARTAAAPALLYGEPDLTIRVIRDVFNEDFGKLVVSGDDAWSMVQEYIQYVAPHLAGRADKWDGDEDVLAAYRIDEQIAKALERKVWLPSGGSLVIDRTEAMTVVDVNTGKFTGQGGNLEETVTRNNLEAAEEIVRQLRLRDIGGIIVIDFIDMVLENNRDLVMRRLLECLSRDRTKHQVAEVTSLGLVQMTRKRVGQGLLEAFSEVCECCNGRGIHVQTTPVDHTPEKEHTPPGGRKRKRKGEIEKAVEEKLAQSDNGRADTGRAAEGRSAGGRKHGQRRHDERAEVTEVTGTEQVPEVSELPEATELAEAAQIPAAAEVAVPSETAVTESLPEPEPEPEPEPLTAGEPPAGAEAVPFADGAAVDSAVTANTEAVDAEAGKTGHGDVADEAGEPGEPGEAGEAEDAAGTGRRRRQRRPRARAEAAADD